VKLEVDRIVFSRGLRICSKGPAVSHWLQSVVYQLFPNEKEIGSFTQKRKSKYQHISVYVCVCQKYFLQACGSILLHVKV